MWKIIEAKDTEKDTIIPMCDMKPMQVGVLMEASEFSDYTGKHVMKSRLTQEVMVIGHSYGWSDCTSIKIKVRLLRKGESITVKLFNEE